MPRLHILGASGSGTTTLGAALGVALAIPHHDSDAFFWLPTDPPFTTPRPLSARQALLTAELQPDADWILSGSTIAWAGPIENLYDMIVYLRLDPTLRIGRLRLREQMRMARASPQAATWRRAARPFPVGLRATTWLGRTSAAVPCTKPGSGHGARPCRGSNRRSL